VATFTIHRDGSALLRDWGESRAAVYFDFGETDSPLWRLYPLSGSELAYLTPIVRAEFVKAHSDGENLERMSMLTLARDLQIASARGQPLPGFSPRDLKSASAEATPRPPLPGFPRFPTRRTRRF